MNSIRNSKKTLSIPQTNIYDCQRSTVGGGERNAKEMKLKISCITYYPGQDKHNISKNSQKHSLAWYRRPALLHLYRIAKRWPRWRRTASIFLPPRSCSELWRRYIEEGNVNSKIIFFLFTNFLPTISSRLEYWVDVEVEMKMKMWKKDEIIF